ncbi:SRPBCC family protein [Jannaschia ovalis]|uniref:SRPBCC family protein n=1 Tax=Jannaschia ovalis TaxID=3038773 RepID=A0ABY8LBC3_9RHOB|nr:SRPBCC family protein [Jannaschia sp. GRR-S6-38]WGH78576.1 SRPBCC family protein [Jannaschia sp. GRR-S6-38]
MDTSRTARTYLGLNAAFSLAMGAGLLIAPNVSADLLFRESASWQPAALRLLGAGLILFGAALILMARDRFLTAGQVLVITMMDIGWILGSALLLLVGGGLFSGFGQAVILAVAGVVAVFAIGQFVGARRIEPPLSQASVTIAGGKIRASVSRAVDAPQDVVWRVMTDHPGYADVADNISKVEVVRGEGLGMQRRCYSPKGENWLETCDLYEDGRAFGFRIHTEADDYPYPISDLHGTWSVARDGEGSKFAIAIEARPKGDFLTQTLFKTAAKRQFKCVLSDLADAWAARMEREARG